MQSSCSLFSYFSMVVVNTKQMTVSNFAKNFPMTGIVQRIEGRCCPCYYVYNQAVIKEIDWDWIGIVRDGCAPRSSIFITCKHARHPQECRLSTPTLRYYSHHRSLPYVDRRACPFLHLPLKITISCNPFLQILVD
jgi:hypothetical protein